MNLAECLHQAVAAVAPIEGVSIDKRSTPPKVRIDFLNATDDERAAAHTVVANFDWCMTAEKEKAVKRKAQSDQFRDSIRGSDLEALLIECCGLPE